MSERLVRLLCYTLAGAVLGEWIGMIIAILKAVIG